MFLLKGLLEELIPLGKMVASMKSDETGTGVSQLKNTSDKAHASIATMIPFSVHILTSQWANSTSSMAR